MIRLALFVLTALAAVVAAGRSPARAAVPEWIPVYDRAAPATTSIEMFDDERGLAVIGYGVQRTTDGGRMWTEPDPSIGIGGGHIAFGDADHAWIAGFSGVMLRTDDGGQSWSPQRTGTDAHFNAIAALSADEAWATAYGVGFSDIGPMEHAASVLLHTVDGGATWQPVRMSDYGIFYGVWFVGHDGWLLASQCHPGDRFAPPEGVGPACQDRYTLLHSGDGGRSWAAIAPPPVLVPVQFQWLDATHGFGVSRTCTPSVCGDQLYATADGGRTWEARHLLAEDNSYVYGLRFTSVNDGWVGIDDCTVPDCSFRLAHTMDGGQTWTFVDAASPMPPSPALDVTSTHVEIAAPDTGISRYDPRSGAWDPSETAARPVLSQFVFATRDRGYAVAAGLWVTEDGGETWAPGPAVPEPLNHVEARGGVLWAMGQHSHVFRSDDRGGTWRQVAVPPEAASSSQFTLQAADGQRAWLALTGGLWRTDDGGATWKHVDTASGGQYTFVDHDHGWTTSCGKSLCENAIRVTSDGGETWELRPVPANAYVQSFATPLDSWGAVFESNANVDGVQCPCVIATHDGGRSWRATSTTPWTINSMHFVDALRGWAIGYDTSVQYPAYAPPAILSTSDGGRTWTKEFDLSGYISAGFTSAAGRVWLSIARSSDPWSYGRIIIYRRDVASAPLIAPDTGTGSAGTPGVPAKLALAGVLALMAGLAGRRFSPSARARP